MTDGIIEAKSPAGEQFGQDRLSASCESISDRSTAEMMDALNQSFRSFCGSAPVTDDLTVVIVCRTAYLVTDSPCADPMAKREPRQ